MNQAYKLVWDELRGMLVVVAENSGRRCKKAGKIAGRAAAPVFALTLAAGMLAPMGAGDAWAFVCQNEVGGTGGSQAGKGTVACGDNVRATSERSVAIGSNTTHSWGNTVAERDESVAIGFDAKARGGQNVVIGSQAHANKGADQSIVIGANVRADGASAIAIGGDDIGTSSTGNNLHDAWQSVKDLANDLDKQNLPKPGMVQRVTGGQWYQDTTRARGHGSVAIGTKAISTGNLSGAFGMGAESLGKGSTALGTVSLASGEFSSALGAAATAAGTRSSSYGMGTAAVGTDSVALGTGAYAGEAGSVNAINTAAFEYQKALSAYDELEKQSNPSQTALRNAATAREQAKQALEYEIAKYGETYGRSVAVGAKAQAAVADGVALGSSSVANRDAADSAAYQELGSRYGYDVLEDTAHTVGGSEVDSTWAPTLGAVSVGGATKAPKYLDENGQLTDDPFDASGNQRPLAYRDPNGNLVSNATNERDYENGKPLYFLNDTGDAVTTEALDANGNARAIVYLDENKNRVRNLTNEPVLGADVVGTRRITNVAAGSLDTDAVNVAQLKLVNQELGKGWSIGGDITNPDGTITTGDTVNIKNGDQVDFKPGDGTTVTITGPKYDPKTGDLLENPSVAYNVKQADAPTVGDTGTIGTTPTITIINPDGSTTQQAWDAGKPAYWDASQTATAINSAAWRTQGAANGGVFTGSGEAAKIHAGDLVKFEAGSGVTLNAQHRAGNDTTPGQSTYTFAVNRATDPTPSGGQIGGGTTNQYWDSSQTQTAINDAYWKIGTGAAPTNNDANIHAGDRVGLIAGNGITITPSTENASNNFTISIDTPITPVPGGGNDIYVGDNRHDSNNNQIQVRPGAGNPVIIRGGADTSTTTLTEKNIGVVADPDNDTLWVKLREDIDLGSNGSVQMGDTVVNDEGITINNGPTITKTNVDMGGQQIHNVDAGTDSNDAATVGQLTQVQAGKNVSVAHSGGNGAPNVYTVSAAGVKAADDVTTQKYITVSGGPQGDGTLKDYEIKFDDSALNTAIGNSGWTIGNPDHTEVGPVEVKNGNTVNFIDGNGTTVRITQAEGTNPASVTYDVNKNKTDPKPTSKGVITGGTSNEYWDSLQVQSAVNGASWNVRGGEGVTNARSDGNNYANINAGKNVEFTSKDKSVVITHSDYMDGSNVAGSSFDFKVNASSVADEIVNTEELANKFAHKYEGDAAAVNIPPSGNVNLVKPGLGGTLPLVGHTVDGADGVYNGTYYSSHNMQIVTARVQGNAGAPPRDILVAQFDNNPTFRNRSGQDTVKISGDQGTISAGRGGSTGNAPPVVVGTQTPPSSSYVGNGGPNPATGNYVTGLENKKWSNGNYVSGRAATEDQLQAVAESMDLSFSGDRNIWVGRSGNHVSIRLNPNVHVDSVTVNDGVYVVDGPSMTKQGINAAGTTITNVAPGIEETDAVNVGQLRRLEHKVNKMGDRADAGIAGAMAAAAVPQVTVPGANLLGAGAGYFHDQSAVAVGYSAMSDNGKWILKANASVSTEEAAASAGVGYQW